MTQEAKLKVNKNGQVEIPAAFRTALGIKAGDVLVLRADDDELKMTTMKKRIEQAASCSKVR